MSDTKEKIINIRCDEEIHKQFAEICTRVNSNISSEIRVFMKNCVASGKIIKSRSQGVHTGDFRDSMKGYHNVPPQW
jgi:preprotein translocase subunit SecD